MIPLDIAKNALARIIREGNTDAAMIAVEALTEIAIEEQTQRKRPIPPAMIKRLFGGSH